MLLGSFADGLAQEYESEQGKFAVNQVRGCAPLDVEVIRENLPPSNTSPPIYDFSYGGDIKGSINFDLDQDYQDTTYAIPGTYKILQIVSNEFDSITIEVLEPRPPQFRVFNCVNNGIYLEINDNYYDRFRVNFGDVSPPVEIATDQPFILYQYPAQGEYTITVQGLFDNADSQNCSVADTTITTINDLTQANLTTVAVEGDRAVRVRYQLPNPNVSYQLVVAEAGQDDFGFARYNLDNESELLIDNLDVNLREQSFCFRVAAVNRCDESLNEYSATVCSIALRGEAQNLQNQLNWQTEGSLEYQILRDGTPLITTSGPEFLDTEVDCQQEYQYRVFAERPDGAITSSTVTLRAQSDAVPAALDSVGAQVPGQQVAVGWRPTLEATQYYLYRGVDGQDPVLYDSVVTATPDDSSGNLLPAPRYEDTQVEGNVEYCYRVTYRDVCGNESARSEPVCALVPTQGEVFFPNAFTPNDDGLNDVFVYTSRLVEAVDLQVYNRWGEVLFQTDQLDTGWDGSYQGTPAPQGTYLYKIEVVDQLGNRFTRQGSFVLLGQ